MAALEQLEAALRKADAAGNADDAKRFAAAIREMQTAQPEAYSPERAVEHYQQHGVPGQHLQAFADKAIEAIPVAGPAIKGGLEAARGGIGDFLRTLGIDAPTGEEINSSSEMAVKGEPGAAAAGEVFGTVAPLAVAGMPAMGARLLGAAGGLPSRVAFGSLSGAGLSYADTLARGGESPDTAAAIGGTVGAALPLGGRVASSVLSRFMGDTVPPEVAALAKSLADDGVPPEQIPARLAAMGDEAMVMDLGPNLQSHAGALASLPGAAQQNVRAAVAARGAGASGRVADDVAATVGTSPDLMTLTDQITTAQSAAAKPLYDAIRDVPIQVPPVIDFILKSPMGQQAFRQAQRLAANDGYKLPEGQVTVGLVDYAKRALDDIATAAARQGNNNVARQARNMTKGITSAVDQQVPAYKQARDAFAGPAQVLDAIESGQAVFTKEMSPAQLKSTMSQMSASERDGYLAGAQGSLEAMLGNAVNDSLSLRNTFRKGWNEAKLRILLGDDIADDLLKRIDREAAFSTTTNVVSRNSETARRTAAQQAVDPRQQDVGGTSAFGFVLQALNKARAKVRGVVQPKVNARLAALLGSSADQVTPQMVEQIKRASLPRPNAAVAPAAAALAITGQ